ncbi:class I SAM-dependent methyltransferase [Comamonas faecalis]|uniref:Class I SAM-dependent methyltransferase n=1 Tax=Comamonas faecalis TaxID=1387849 RepID=A0ABP7RYT9_9BURK
MQSASADIFDEAYYQRYYYDRRTRVIDKGHTARLGQFIASYLAYLRVPVHRVLDMGCGIGLWQGIAAQHWPGAQYHGVELSPYLCQRYGWQQGSVLDYRADAPYDLVICQGVLPYLARQDLQRALDNLGRLAAGALYLEAVTQEDFEQGSIDEERTDTRQYRHRASLYRRALAAHAIDMGGGLWLSRQAEVPVFALEAPGL